MADEIYLARLDEIVTDLGTSKSEFEDASQIARDIARSVGNPKGKGDLKNRVEDFEDDWNDTRDDLLERLSTVHQKLNEIRCTFQEWDLETKKAFLNSRSSDIPKAAK